MTPVLEVELREFELRVKHDKIKGALFANLLPLRKRQDAGLLLFPLIWFDVPVLVRHAPHEGHLVSTRFHAHRGNTRKQVDFSSTLAGEVRIGIGLRPGNNVLRYDIGQVLGK